MNKINQQLDQRVDRLAEQLARAKRQKLLADNAARHKHHVREKRARDQTLYRLGGLVEKMGLDQLDEPLLLGLLCFCNDAVASNDSSVASDFRQKGSPYQAPGIKKARLLPFAT